MTAPFFNRSGELTCFRADKQGAFLAKRREIS